MTSRFGHSRIRPFGNVHSQCRRNTQVRTFSNNLRYKCTSTKTMYDVGVHSSLKTSAIIALGLLKNSKESGKTDEQFCVGRQKSYIYIYIYVCVCVGYSMPTRCVYHIHEVMCS